MHLVYESWIIKVPKFRCITDHCKLATHFQKENYKIITTLSNDKRQRILSIMEIKVFTTFILLVMVSNCINAAPATNDVHSTVDFNVHSKVEECVTVDGLVKCTKQVCGWDKKANSIICTTTESDQPSTFNVPEVHLPKLQILF